MNVKATKLLGKLNAGEKTTASEVTNAAIDDVVQWPVVTSMYEKNKSTDPEDHAKAWIKVLLGRGDGPREAAISLLEGIKEDHDAENQIVDEFMCRTLNGVKGYRYMQYCLPIWFAYWNPDSLANDAKKIGDSYDAFRYYHEDGGSVSTPLALAQSWTMDDRYGGRNGWSLSGKEKDEFYALTCGDVWENVVAALQQIQLSKYFEGYLEKLDLPGVPWVGLPGFPFEGLQYEIMAVPSKKGSSDE